MELKIECSASRGVSDSSRAMLDAALSHMFETSLGVRLDGLSCDWQVAEDGGPSIRFAATASPFVAIQGTVLAEKGVLKGFTGAYSTDARDWDATARPFKLKITPMSTLWILAAARDNCGPQLGGGPAQPQDAEFAFDDSFMERAIQAYDEIPNIPYEFKTPGHMDGFLRQTLACMERTIMERMDCQDMFIDRIALPDGVSPGASAVVLERQPFGDILLVEPRTGGGGGKGEKLGFSSIGTDAAAAITRYVMEQYPKKPLLGQ